MFVFFNVYFNLEKKFKPTFIHLGLSAYLSNVLKIITPFDS